MIEQLVIDNIPNTTIQGSSVHGKGLFAVRSFPPSVILLILDGQEIDYEVYLEKNLALEWNAISKTKIIVRPYRTKYSFINHSKVPNLVVKHNPLRVETIITIKEGEELFLNYLSEPLPDQYLVGHGKSYLYD